MKAVLIRAVAAALLGSTGIASAAPPSLYKPHHGREPIVSAWTADRSVATRPPDCNGYGYAYGSEMFCETATGGPVGGIN